MKTRVSVYFLLLVVILALVIQGDTALGKTTEDSDLYAPMVFKQPFQTQPNTPSGVLYVFFSTESTNGNAGGRVGMDTICSNTDPSSHFCSIHEIENAWINTGVYFNTPLAETGWLDNPTMLGTTIVNQDLHIVSSDWQYTSSWSASCQGWTVYTDLGWAIESGANDVTQYSCNEVKKVTCCKWNP